MPFLKERFLVLNFEEALMCLFALYLFISSVSPTFLWVRPMCRAHYPWWLEFSGVSVPKLSSCVVLSFICMLRSLLFLVLRFRPSFIAQYPWCVGFGDLICVYLWRLEYWPKSDIQSSPLWGGDIIGRGIRSKVLEPWSLDRILVKIWKNFE